LLRKLSSREIKEFLEVKQGNANDEVAGEIRFDPPSRQTYLARVPQSDANAMSVESSPTSAPQLPLDARLGASVLEGFRELRNLVAFALITLGVLITRFNLAAQVVHPLIRRQITRAGVRLIPMVLFLALALGLVIISQTVVLLTRVGAQELIGTVMVTVVVRELGPIVAALLVMARVGTATVIELGTARALGEVEALEALGIDPVHFLVVPRVIGVACSVFALTVYLILGALFSGYLFAFVQDVNLTPGAYASSLAASLWYTDFALLALKTLGFGALIGTVSCFHGLAQPLRLPEVAHATTRAVVQCVVGCVAMDALFIVVYLLA
jgi:phospholipid/cholesterol/gamma-HCH transport system permease protein